MSYLTPKGYTTKQEVEDYLFADLDPAYDEALDDLIAKAEAEVERLCRRRFDSYTDDQEIAGNGLDVIAIPDTQSLTNITLDPFYGNLLRTEYDAAGEDAYWTLEPTGAAGRDKPYTRLRLLGPGLYPRNPLQTYVFPHPGKVTLKGTFGWPSVPPAIRLATTMLVGDMTRRWRNPQSGDVQSLTEGAYSVTFAATEAKPDFPRLVPYKRPRLIIPPTDAPAYGARRARR